MMPKQNSSRRRRLQGPPAIVGIDNRKIGEGDSDITQVRAANGIITSAALPESEAIQGIWRALEDIKNLSSEDSGWRDFVSFAVKFSHISHAQLFQDLWVLWETGSMRSGYFAEFGACDGLKLSNTALLEESFGWNGVVAEPNPVYHMDLAKNRNCRIERRCVWSCSGEKMMLRAVAEPEFSRLEDVAPDDMHEVNGRRNQWSPVFVETISLSDLLRSVAAPHTIDYISVDTEGSELEVLEGFDFKEFDVRLMTVEHNFTPRREEIFRVMARNGYERRFEAWTRWDDWYVKRE